MSNPEAGRSQEDELNRAAITSAANFDELYQALEMMGGVQGSKQHQSAEELKAAIENIRKGQSKPETVTRSLGLREKVLDLLLKPEEEK